MEDVLAKAIEEELLSFHLQPIVCLSTNLCTGFELLSRCPELGFETSSPSYLLYKIGSIETREKHFKISVKKALATRKALDSIALNDLAICVNICITDFSVENCRWIDSVSNNNPHKLKGICFEVSEQVDTYLTPSMIQRIQKIRRNGATIAIDDYGVGYSNDTRTASMPFDTVKLDKRFLSAPVMSLEYVELKEKTYSWHMQAKNVVMEGVENSSHVKKAQALKASHTQGYFYSHAMPFLEAIKWLKEHNLINIEPPKYSKNIL